MYLDRRPGLRIACINHLNQPTSEVRQIYWDVLPEHFVKTGFKANIHVKDVKWQEDTDFTEENSEDGRTHLVYTEACMVDLAITFESLILIPRDIRVLLYFTVKCIDKGSSLWIRVETQRTRDFMKFHAHLIETQNRFGLVSIDTYKFGGKSGFDLYCDITRKKRISLPKEAKIGDYDFYAQIAFAHGEVADFLSKVVSYYPLISNLDENRIEKDGKAFYRPNIGYYDYQYFMSCSYSIERLYTFWETLGVLIHAYDTKDPDKYFSFNRYIQGKKGKVPLRIFDPTSINLKWFTAFCTTHHAELTKYRHRIVHHQFNEENDGILTAKFYLNAHKGIADEQSIRKYDREMKQMPKFLIEQFELCIVGFEKALALIDELN